MNDDRAASLPLCAGCASFTREKLLQVNSPSGIVETDGRVKTCGCKLNAAWRSEMRDSIIHAVSQRDNRHS